MKRDSMIFSVKTSQLMQEKEIYTIIHSTWQNEIYHQ